MGSAFKAPGGVPNIVPAVQEGTVVVDFSVRVVNGIPNATGGVSFSFGDDGSSFRFATGVFVRQVFPPRPTDDALARSAAARESAQALFTDPFAPLNILTPLVAPVSFVDANSGRTVFIGTDRGEPLAGAALVAGEPARAELNGDAFVTALATSGGAPLRIEGRGGGDTIQGGLQADLLLGQGGNDSMNGSGGSDTLVGDTGSDTLDGGSGRDRLIGGSGDDLYTVGQRGDAVVERADEGDDSVASSVSLTLAKHVEDLFLQGSDNLSGTGNGLANVIEGTIGNNTLKGAAGDDVLGGNAGRDRMFGGDGADTLNGGSGRDVLSGNAGADTFVYLRLADSPASEDGRDRISDFDAAAGDRIDLRALGLEAVDISLADGILSADTSGDGQADFQIELPGVGTLPADALLL
jgi:Ca2+-binding RTX toxin-like protein